MATAKLNRALSKTFAQLNGERIGVIIDAPGLYLNRIKGGANLNIKQAPSKPGVALL